MNHQQSEQFINKMWDEHILPSLMDYIKIPNKSPQFDPDWQTNGYMDQAVNLLSQWCKKHAIPGMTLEVVRLEQKTPIILIEIPGQTDETILLYGHLDKQPEMSGWDEDLNPWKPVLRGDKLYGRGAADDGYAIFSSFTAIKSLHEQHIPHARCVILIEACEESGSPDLPFYVNALEHRIGHPDLVICLDSGCGNYEQLWLTTSLRGMVSGILNISTLKQGVHSGNGSGVAPSCFRILRQCLNRIENEITGDITLDALQVIIPKERELQANQAAEVLGNAVFADLPFQADVLPESLSISDLILRRTWKPALSVTGCDGIPAIQQAGNVTLPSIAVKLSMRLPPTCPPQQAALTIKQTLENHPPYRAKIHFDLREESAGWHAPIEQPWLVDALQKASQTYFGKQAVYMGEGGTIPFMGMLGKKFPHAQFIITGLLGPGSNAHGPNEFLHIPMAKKLTACIAQMIAEHYIKIATNKRSSVIQKDTRVPA